MSDKPISPDSESPKSESPSTESPPLVHVQQLLGLNIVQASPWNTPPQPGNLPATDDIICRSLEEIALPMIGNWLNWHMVRAKLGQPDCCISGQKPALQALRYALCHLDEPDNCMSLVHSMRYSIRTRNHVDKAVQTVALPQINASDDEDGDSSMTDDSAWLKAKKFIE